MVTIIQVHLINYTVTERSYRDFLHTRRFYSIANHVSRVHLPLITYDIIIVYSTAKVRSTNNDDYIMERIEILGHPNNQYLEYE